MDEDVLDFLNKNFFKCVNKNILHSLRDGSERTSREISGIIGVEVKNVRPRISELIDCGAIEKSEKKHCKSAGYRVLTYKLYTSNEDLSNSMIES